MTTQETNPKTVIQAPVGQTKTQTITDLYSAVMDETVPQFDRRCLQAEIHKMTAVEASDDLITYYNPDGLGPHAPYFMKGRLRVYQVGTKESEEAKERAMSEKRENKSYFEGRA